MTTRNITPSDLALALRAAADALDELARTRSVELSDWVSQSESPLGRKHHCAAVRARIAKGLDGASIIGRRHLLSQQALADVLTEMGRPSEAPVSDPASALERKLRLVGGAL